MAEIHPLWQDQAALDRLARRIATRLELHAVEMALRTGHPCRPYCPGPPGRGDGQPICGPKSYPTETDGKVCFRCGGPVYYPAPPMPHF